MSWKAWLCAAFLLLTLGVAYPQVPNSKARTAATPKNDPVFDTAMQKLEDTWVTEFNAGHADKVAALYAPEAVLMRWDGTVHGSDSILAEFQRSAAAGTGNYVVHRLHVERSGDLGYESGAYNVTIRGREVEGNYLVVVKNIRGQWKIVAHATTANPAAP